jgi:G3E family GTPase
LAQGDKHFLESIMLFDHLFPPNLVDSPESTAQEVMKTVLIRTNFVPVLRHVIGWRGLKQGTGKLEFWTAKIKKYDGVFGLAFQGTDSDSQWCRARFLLYYFPNPDEELVENCSLQAAALTQSSKYFPRIREFAFYPEFADLFSIADIILSFNADRKSLTLGLDVQETLRSISKSGVHLEQDGKMVFLIEPGGLDQNFPALTISSHFFNTLAASVTFNLNQPPVFLKEETTPGFEVLFTDQGWSKTLRSNEISCHHFILGYGSGCFEGCDACRKESQLMHHWSQGQDVPPNFQDRLWWKAHEIQGASTIDKKALGVDERPPLIILTGFLGSGKTSFLQYFIEYQNQRSRFVGVIQNEIGAKGLDGKLLDYTVTEIDEGCVCCTLAGSLKRAVNGILASFNPDYILVETTGLANPFNLLEEMEELSDLVRFDSIVTVVDLPNVLKTLSEYPVAAEQIQSADILMLNKKDLVSGQELVAVTEAIQRYNPHAPIFSVSHGEVNPTLIIDFDGQLPRDKKNQSPALYHESHLQEGLWSKSISLTGPVDKEDFIKTVEHFPASIFRAKGVLEFANSSQALLFQYVGGRYEISLFPDVTDKDRFLTVIGKDGDPEVVAASIENLLTTQTPSF